MLGIVLKCEPCSIKALYLRACAYTEMAGPPGEDQDSESLLLASRDFQTAHVIKPHDQLIFSKLMLIQNNIEKCMPKPLKQ